MHLKAAPSEMDEGNNECLMTTQLTFPAATPLSHFVISFKPRVGHFLGCRIDLGEVPSLETQLLLLIL
jgi:hypothetical protein